MEPSIAAENLESPSARRPNIPVLIAVFFVLSVVFTLVTGSPVGGDVVWARNYEAGLAQAKQEGKPILLSLHLPGCPGCKQMDATTFRDKRVVAEARKFVCIGLDYSTDSAIIDRYQVVEYPQTIMLQPDGKEITRWTGYIPPDRFLAALTEISKKKN